MEALNPKNLIHLRLPLASLLLWCLGLLLAGCVESYELPESAAAVHMLVVDGMVDVDEKVVVVKLSRTQNLSEAGSPPLPEPNAMVSVENAAGQRFRLRESGTPGHYVGYNPDWGYNQKLRLHIIAQGKEYRSELVSSSKVPPIDALTWRVEDGNVKIQVSTHDPNNNTKYYRWEFVETYEYRAFFESGYVFTPSGDVVLRPPYAQIYTCWMTTPSTEILVGTSAKLSQDKISDFTLATHTGDGDRFSRRYSTLVRQYALSREEFDYWLMLKKNTENVGSLFDAQPSYVTGNLTCITDPDEPVLGFFSARSTSEKRLFIHASELAQWKFTQPMPFCQIIEPEGGDITPYLNITEPLDSGPLALVTKECADCRLKGGSTQKPSFW